MAAYKMPCLLYFALLYYDMHSELFDQEMRLWRLASFFIYYLLKKRILPFVFLLGKKRKRDENIILFLS